MWEAADGESSRSKSGAVQDSAPDAIYILTPGTTLVLLPGESHSFESNMKGSGDGSGSSTDNGDDGQRSGVSVSKEGDEDSLELLYFSIDVG